MLAEMYKNREKHAYTFLLFTICIVAGFLSFQTPETARKWLEALVFLFL